MSSKWDIPTRTSERETKSSPPPNLKSSTPTRRASSPIFTLLFMTLLSLSLIPSTKAYTPLSKTSLSQLFSSPSSDTQSNFHPKTGTLLSPILIPRVPGTPGSEKVQQHFVDFFARELPEWTLQWQNSTSTTPATGDTKVEFRNLIFRRDPPWLVSKDEKKERLVKRLTLAAHYDSLYRPEGFIGARDKTWRGWGLGVVFGRAHAMVGCFISGILQMICCVCFSNWLYVHWIGVSPYQYSVGTSRSELTM